jgi:arsenate reductase (glutaredoxin)
MDDKITVYEKPTWTKCREADRLLRESGVDYEKINFHVEPIDEAKLRGLLKKLEMPPRELLRKGEAAFRELNLADESHTGEDIIRAMVEHPELIQRPIVERGDRAVLGRPTENIRALLHRWNKW